ncbi:MAG: tetratricopeptide repeat protein, partial [Candidatus Obscuribacterales bacterium]|nr:tetratricopeptide repeat protein [Candidatus Obscuribacterales bacterium]
DPFPGKGDEQTWLKACNVCNQGAQLMQFQRYGEAAKYFEKAIEMYAFDPVFYYDAGLSYQSGAYTMRSPADKKGALEKAESYFAQSAKIKTDKFDTWIHMANVQSELQEYESSLKSLQTALAIPGVPESERQKANLAIEFVKTKMAATAQNNNDSQHHQSANTSTATNTSGWQSYNSSKFEMRYPNGWQVAQDASTGQINISHPSGAMLSVLPFSTTQVIDAKKDGAALLNAMLKQLYPSDSWSKATQAGGNSFKAESSSKKEELAAALVVASNQSGTFGKLCTARLPKNDSSIDKSAFAEMMSTLKIAPQTASVAPTQSQNMAARQQMPMSPQQQMMLMQQPQAWQHMNTGGLPATPFAGYRTFVDPTEHSFTVEVPAGWKVEGGLTRASAIDARPWVKVVSPDNLITAFIGDGSIPPFSVPTAIGTQLGYGVGAHYGGGIVKPYVPASRFVQSYMHDKLKRDFTDLKVIERQEHPDLAAKVNGSVGATRSECSSVKFTAMYKTIPAVGYFIAATKETAAYGAAMWWVTYIAGVIGPADRDAAGLSVILHMMQTFALDPQWQGQSLATTKEVSRQYTIS